MEINSELFIAQMRQMRPIADLAHFQGYTETYIKTRMYSPFTIPHLSLVLSQKGIGCDCDLIS